MISIGGKEVYFIERFRLFRKFKNKGIDSVEIIFFSSRYNSYSKVFVAFNRELFLLGSRYSSVFKLLVIFRKDFFFFGGRYIKSFVVNRRDFVNVMFLFLLKRERFFFYVNVVYFRFGSDIFSNVGSNSIIYYRFGSDIGSSSIGSR